VEDNHTAQMLEKVFLPKSEEFSGRNSECTPIRHFDDIQVEVTDLLYHVTGILRQDSLQLWKILQDLLTNSIVRGHHVQVILYCHGLDKGNFWTGRSCIYVSL
jgi:hypothetical protein